VTSNQFTLRSVREDRPTQLRIRVDAVRAGANDFSDSKGVIHSTAA
jgi:hypothetical protein